MMNALSIFQFAAPTIAKGSVKLALSRSTISPVYHSTTQQSPEAENIDIIYKKFWDLFYDKNTPAYTLPGKLLDYAINFFTKRNDPTLSPTKRSAMQEKDDNAEETIPNTWLYNCNPECKLKSIRSYFTDLGWGTFLFKKLPIQRPLAPGPYYLDFCVISKYEFDHFGSDHSFLLTLSFDEPCSLYWQQKYCIDRAFDPFFAHNPKILKKGAVLTNTSTLNTSFAYIFQKPSKLVNYTWTLKARGFDKSWNSLELTDEIIIDLRKRLDSLVACEINSARAQNFLCIAGVILTSATLTAFAVLKFSRRYQQQNFDAPERIEIPTYGTIP